MMQSIDLNADMGEYKNLAEQQNEIALMPLVSSCSIACGGHTGTPETMRATARLAQKYGVQIGAHPSYPDPDGFGRRSIEISHKNLLESLTAQITGLFELLSREQIPMRHIKPHGSLYNDAAKTPALAAIIARAANGTPLIGPPNSALEQAAKDRGIKFFAEGFVDRLYLASGALTPRSENGAVIADIDVRATQALAIAEKREFMASDGKLRISADTLCIHSDSEGAVETAKAVRTKLESASFLIRSFS
ncbi:5-oxoprolinase subunit PxpA [Hyphococcus lacteus]|uniref:5-oxoprolinase subunit PxpA n=1 Tax=Hyphococcus lacteus TaxID=3143536 RepID=A0ABV3Z695_9PROT